MKRFWFALAGIAVLAMLALQARGPAQLGTDPERAYEVTPALGPWMVCTTSYTGGRAREMAHKLAAEFRNSYGLPAYVFNYVDEDRRKEQERIKQEKERIEQVLQQQQKYLAGMDHAPVAPIHVRTRRFEDQCAVLIGGYKDEGTARREMLRIKNLPPPSHEKVPLACLGILDPVRKGVVRAWENPFKQAFIIHNPTVKCQPPVDRTRPDPLLSTLNADEPNSLLKCPQRFTLVVAQFHGATTVQSRSESSTFLNKLGKGGNPGEVLDAAQRNAHNVAELFREIAKKQFKDLPLAYVLHTRYYSLVTVGGFDRLDDPRLQTLKRQLASLNLHPIPMLPQPLPMEIPRPEGGQWTLFANKGR